MNTNFIIDGLAAVFTEDISIECISVLLFSLVRDRSSSDGRFGTCNMWKIRQKWPTIEGVPLFFLKESRVLIHLLHLSKIEYIYNCMVQDFDSDIAADQG